MPEESSQLVQYPSMRRGDGSNFSSSKPQPQQPHHQDWNHHQAAMGSGHGMVPSTGSVHSFTDNQPTYQNNTTGTNGNTLSPVNVHTDIPAPYLR